jgi:hydroxymethylbilane synthase
MAVLKMGTRGSALALAQSGQSARALEALHPGLKIETVVVMTSGDLFGAPSIEEAQSLPQGAKGFWVKEIEQALLDRTIDFAVHSAKDLPAALAPGLAVAAYPEREDPRDALVAKPGLDWAALAAGARVATSSLRRALLLKELKPGVEVVPLRGNVDTRLRKLEAGEFDAMILAVAGLKRLGRADVRLEALDPAAMLPAPAQGALALEARADRVDVAHLVGALDHSPTRARVELERAFLAAAGGSCGSPVAAHARLEPEGLRLDAFLAREGEQAGRRVFGLCSDPSRRDAFAAELAAQASAR